MRVSVQPHASYRMVENNFWVPNFKASQIPNASSDFNETCTNGLVFSRALFSSWIFKNRLRKSRWIEVKECYFFELCLFISKEITPFLWNSAEAKLLLSVWWNFTWKNALPCAFRHNFGILIILSTFWVISCYNVSIKKKHTVEKKRFFFKNRRWIISNATWSLSHTPWQYKTKKKLW